MVSKTLRSVVADANVLLSASLGHAARKVFEKARVFHVITTDIAAGEVREYLPVLAAKAGLDRAPIIRVFDALPIEIVPESGYRTRLKDAASLIGKRDPNDTTVLALALKRGLPVWSNDDDFDDAGVLVFTTAELLKVLGFSSARHR